MSLEKVNKYRESKKTRKETIAKEKKQKQLQKLIGRIIGIVIVVALVVGIVITCINLAKDTTDNSDYISENYVLGDYADINGEETEAAEETEAEEAAEETEAEESSEEASK